MTDRVPTASLGIARTDLESRGVVPQIGLPPRRIDLMTDVTGIDFESAWRNRVTHRVGVRDLPFLSREDLIRNKKATGRPKDLVDLQMLERVGK